MKPYDDYDVDPLDPDDDDDFDMDDEAGEPAFDDDTDDDDDLLEVEEDDDEFGEPLIEYDTETGAPGRKKRSRPTPKKLRRRKTALKTLRKAKAGRLRANRGGRRKLRKLSRIAAMVNNTDLRYIDVRGGSIQSISLGGPKEKLRPAEIAMLKYAAFNGNVIEPQTFTIGAGAVAQFAFDAQNLAALTGCSWFGFILTVEASNLNQVPGGDFTVNVYSSATASTNPLFSAILRIEAGRQVMQAVILNATLQSGKPRIVVKPELPFNAVAADPPLDGITLNGVPSNYSPKVRMLLPGDHEFEKLLAIL